MRQTIFFPFFSTLFFFLLAYYLQTQFFLSADVGYLIHVAEQLKMGGKYGADFFETNPPLILYLYMPVIFLTKITVFNIALAVRLYLFSLILLSVFSCFTLLTKIIKKTDRLLIYFLTYALLTIFLFLPLNEFGQREHFLIIFIMPYIFSTILVAEKKRLPFWQAILIGFFAGLGFGLKPFFLLTPVLIELYLMLRLRTFWSGARVETLTVLVVLFSYLASIFIFQPTYLTILLPLISEFYFIGTQHSWNEILTNERIFYCLTVLFVYLFLFKYDRYRDMSMIFLLGLVGMMVAFIIPRTPWFYHVIPAFCFACLLMANSFGQMLSSYLDQEKSILNYIRDACFFVIAIGIIFGMPILSTIFSASYFADKKTHQPFRDLENYVNSLPGKKSIFCFSVNTTKDCFPLVYETHSQYATRFPFFWWFRGLLIKENSAQFSEKIKKNKNYLIEQVVNDLNQLKPNIVIVNKLSEYLYLPANVKLVNYFLKDEKFKLAWRHYSYVTMIDRYAIYQRNSDGNHAR